MSIYEVNIVADLESFDYTGLGNEINVVTNLTSFNYSGTSATTEFEITSPAEGQQIPEGNFPITVTFEDTASPDGWRVQIATDSGFTNIVFDDKTVTKSINVDSLAIDVYYAKIIRLSIDEGTVIPVGDNSRAGDEESLQLLYDSLGGASWTDNTGWASSGMSLDPAPFGVTTDTIGGELRVTQIDLEANNLIGTIPEFPALNEMWFLKLKQQEDVAGQVGQRITGTIPDSIGNNTKVTHLSLAGRPGVDFVNPTSYNKKSRTPSNQFTGGMPSSMYNLALEHLELEGQTALEATLTSGVANWNIKSIFMASATFSEEATKTTIVGAWPSESKNWVDCEFFYITDNLITSFPLDMFEGWNTISNRRIQMGFEARGDLRYGGQGEINQSMPRIDQVTDLYEFSSRNRRFTGPPPFYFFDFPSMNSITQARQAFEGSIPFSIENKVASISSFLQFRQNSVPPQNPMSGSLFNGDAENSNVILYDLTGQSGLRNVLVNGMDQWSRLRYIQVSGTGGTTLPTKAPGQWATSLRQFDASNANLRGNITDSYANVGSIEARGGTLDSGTITADGEDPTFGFWIEDSSKSYQEDELVGLVVRHPNPDYGGGRSRARTITKNTSDRIYYTSVDINGNDVGFEDIDIGEVYDIHRNNETDVRPFDQGYLLNGNNLTGILPAGGAPTQMEGGTFNISNNRYTMAQLAPHIQSYIDQASSSGYTFTYAPQKKFDEEVVEELISGSDLTIDYSAFDYAGNVYTWYKDDVVISGETDSSLALTNITEGATYRCEVTNSAVPGFTNVSNDTIISII